MRDTDQQMINYIKRLSLVIHIRKLTASNIEDFYNEKLSLWYYKNSDTFESIDGTDAIIKNGDEFDNYDNFTFSKTQNGFFLDELDFIKSEIQYLNEFEFKSKLSYSQTKQFKLYLDLLTSKVLKNHQPEAVIPDEVNESYKLKENIFDNVKPINVIKHFSKLVENGYISQENFNDFLFTVFEKNETLPIPFEILKRNSKTRVKNIFYDYYDTYGNKYGSQEKYINLLCNTFIGFNSKTLSTNFAK